MANRLASIFFAMVWIAGAHAAERSRHDEVAQMLMIMDGPRDSRCAERKIVKTEVVESRPDGAPAVERWTLDRCGKLVNYRVKYSRNAKGGTDFDAQLEK